MNAAYASVQRTPDLLPVLKENGVVDAGGYGLAIFFDSFVAALTGRTEALVDEMAFARTCPEGGDRADHELGRFELHLLQRIPRSHG